MDALLPEIWEPIQTGQLLRWVCAGTGHQPTIHEGLDLKLCDI